MATEIVSHENVESLSPANIAAATLRASGALRRMSAALASPKITVVLVLAAIGLVLVGSLAQVQRDIWEVVTDYFRAWVCRVELKVLFPAAFFPWAAHTDWNSLSVRYVPFPGGGLIGLALAINLAAALAVRFPIRAQGARRVWGLVVLAAGVVTTLLVIEWGHNRYGVQGKPPLEWSTLWALIRTGLIGLCIACFFRLARVWRSGYRGRTGELAILGAITLGLSGLLGWIFVRGDAAVLTDSSLRILYQLIQGGIAALVLLGACVLLFRDRAGSVLLHGGVALLMFGEFYVSQFSEEQQMTLVEGQSVNCARDTRSVDLAISTRMRDREEIVAIPMETNGKTTRSAQGRPSILNDLPFDVKVVRYFKDSRLTISTPHNPNPATNGVGTSFAAEEASPKGGVQNGLTDLASAYVKITGKEGAEDLGTYLVSQHLPARQSALNAVSLRGKKYSLDLRFKLSYKPYQITLLDVRRDDYVGTGMARNYASRVRLTDSSRNVDFESKIWMNNPLRYAGETFYQSGYNVDRSGKESSTLQVVKNIGWMIPYVSCMIVATGMLWHFVLMLLRFLQRTQRGAEAAETLPRTGVRAETVRSDRLRLLVPAAVVAIAVSWLAWMAVPSLPSGGELQWERFGALPLMYEGRVKPFDTLARSSLRIISGRETFVDEQGKTQPAIRWLLDVIARPEAARKHRVFRIEATELRDTLGLERRKDARFAWAEFNPDSVEFGKRVMSASRQDPRQRVFQQRKLMDLAQRVDRYRVLADSFHPLPLPPVPTREESVAAPEQAAQAMAAIERFVKDIPMKNHLLQSLHPPLAVPAGPAEQPWLAYAAAWNDAYAIQFSRNGEPAPATMKLSAIFDAYRQGRAPAFNAAVADYEALLADVSPEGLDLPLTRFEAFINRFAPFFNSIPLYGVALMLTVGAWLAAVMTPRWSTLMRIAAFWLIVTTFMVHTFALGARVVISGRPPVTNLYSTAVFIGWGCVAIGMLMEIVFRLGIGNFVSAVAGIGTLIIAHILAADGDTIRVLQAVIDTQFWLTVHVLTITLGYSAMFLAGLIGMASIACGLGGAALTACGRGRGKPGHCGRSDDRFALWPPSSTEQNVDSMIYSSICFAAFFSLVGTVLGGLWADHSWGRFWGWDPKENGALIIVLWTTLVLHARSARMVGQRGMAILAVGGNIVTSWSWFGVNELGVGLHAYGFTEGVANSLQIFWASQLAIIGLALLPTMTAWLSSRRTISAEGRSIVVGLLVALGVSAFAGNAAAQSGTGTQSVYVGDATCSSCHEKEYDTYKKHGHSSMSVPTGGERPPDDLFPGGIALPELPINTATGQQMTWADVVEIFGNFKNGEGYLVRASDGKFVASGRVPANSCIHCHDIPSQKHAKTPATSLQSESCAGCHHSYPAEYSPTCFKCHNTGYDPDGKQYGLLNGSWALDGIQCEHCHGPATTMKIPDVQICRDCHSAGDPQFRVAFSAKSSVLIGGTGFTGHHAEGDEYRRSPHNNLGCIACHDPHRSVWHDDGGVKYAENGIGNMCSHCHTNRVLGVMGQIGLKCVDCHMPKVSSNGNRANHLVSIGTTSLAAGDNTYQADGGTWWKTDTNGNSFLTLDLVCASCHANMTLPQMASYAKRIHHQSTYLDLWVNGSDGLQHVNKSQIVSVDFSVRANEKRGMLTDWWVLRRGVTGWSSWNGRKWVRGMKPWRKQFGLVDVPTQNILKSKLSPGHYTFWVNLNFADGTDEVAAVPLQVAK